MRKSIIVTMSFIHACNTVRVRLNQYLNLQINHANITALSQSRQKHSSSLVIPATYETLRIHRYVLVTRVCVNMEGWIVQKVRSSLDMFHYSLVKQSFMKRVVGFVRQYGWHFPTK